MYVIIKSDQVPDGNKVVKIHSKVYIRIMYPVGDELATVFNFDALFSLC